MQVPRGFIFHKYISPPKNERMLRKRYENCQMYDKIMSDVFLLYL